MQDIILRKRDKECRAEEAIKAGDKWKISISVRYGAPMVAEDIAKKLEERMDSKYVNNKTGEEI